LKIKAQDIHVGNIVWLRENDEVPCDLVLIGTSDLQGICYVEVTDDARHWYNSLLSFMHMLFFKLLSLQIWYENCWINSLGSLFHSSCIQIHKDKQGNVKSYKEEENFPVESG